MRPSENHVRFFQTASCLIPHTDAKKRYLLYNTVP